MKHATKELAEAAVDRMNKKGIDKFCPLIRAMCRQDCASYGPARIHMRYTSLHTGQAIYVDPARCDNTIITGYLDCSQ